MGLTGYMTEEEVLDQLIYERAINSLEIYLNSAAGAYFRNSTGEFIFINKDLETKEKIWAKAHEYGHAMTAQRLPECADDERYNEALADRYAYSLVMPPEKLIQSHQLGIRDEDTLSDFLMIPIDRIVEGLRMYADIHGPRYRLESWNIQWLPLRISRRAA